MGVPPQLGGHLRGDTRRRSGDGGLLDICDDPELTEIPGLQVLTTVDSDVVITGNGMLPTCTAQAVVNPLDVNRGMVDLAGNLPDTCSP